MKIKVSLIIAVYKDYEALDIILSQLLLQTYNNFEVIIAEDAKSKEIPEIIQKYSSLDIKHCSQEDTGIRKMRSQNNAVKKSSGEYLIFIDGDCIPYPNFISAHVALAKKNYVSSGRRVNLGPKFSSLIRKRNLKASTIANNFFFFFIPLLVDGKEGHIESGFTFNPDGWIYKSIFSNAKRSTGILGCNFACFRQDIIAINGFDECYGETAIGDDTDIEWRFSSYGLEIQSVKNAANVFHLYHEKRTRIIPYHEDMLKLMQKRKSDGNYKAQEGLDSER